MVCGDAMYGGTMCGDLRVCGVTQRNLAETRGGGAQHIGAARELFDTRAL